MLPIEVPIISEGWREFFSRNFIAPISANPSDEPPDKTREKLFLFSLSILYILFFDIII